MTGSTSDPGPWTAEPFLASTINRQLEWFGLKFPIPNTTAYVISTIKYLDVRGDAQFEALSLIVSSAREYQGALEDQKKFGLWKRHSEKLQKLYEQADDLANALEKLEEGTRLAWDLAERSIGASDAGHGLFSPLDSPLPLSPKGKHFRKFIAEPDPEMAEASVMVHVPLRELAKRLASASAWMKQHGVKVGPRLMMDMAFGPPELGLFSSLKVGLSKLGLDPKHAWPLGKRVSRMVIGSRPCDHWADEARRKTEIWFTKVEPWIHTEADAPEDVQRMLRLGPRIESSRKVKDK